MSRAVMYETFGGPEVLELREVPEPHAGPGEVRARVAAAGLNPMDQSLTAFTQPPRQVAWQQKPTTYFVCTEDLATPGEVQRQRVRANTRRAEFSAGHHPFLSRPDAFAESIAAAINHD